MRFGIALVLCVSPLVGCTFVFDPSTATDAAPEADAPVSTDAADAQIVGDGAVLDPIVLDSSSLQTGSTATYEIPADPNPRFVFVAVGQQPGRAIEILFDNIAMAPISATPLADTFRYGAIYLVTSTDSVQLSVEIGNAIAVVTVARTAAPIDMAVQDSDADSGTVIFCNGAAKKISFATANDFVVGMVVSSDGRADSMFAPADGATELSIDYSGAQLGVASAVFWKKGAADLSFTCLNTSFRTAGVGVDP